MSLSFEGAKSWLLDSGLYCNKENDENLGGVHSFYDEKQEQYGFFYPEITGYFVSSLIFLNDVEKKSSYLLFAKQSSDWLVALDKKYGGIIQGIVPNQQTKHLVYTFDSAICAKGILDYYLVSNNNNYLNFAKKIIFNLIDEALEKDGTIKPYKNLENGEYEESNEVWYKQKGCLHIKTSMPFFQLYQITKEEKLFEIAKQICDTYSKFLKPDGSIRLHLTNDIVNLHAMLYALEGLIYAYHYTKNENYLDCCKKSASWCLQKINSDNSINLWHNSKYRSKASYPIAQLIRILIILDKFDNDNKYDEFLKRMLTFLAQFQASSDDNRINGGIYEEFYKSLFGWKMRYKLNSWATMFTLQAIYWYENRKKVSLTNMIRHLY